MEGRLDEGLHKHVRMFENSEEATNDERQRNERDRDYYDKKQLTTKERAELARRKQPPVIYNRIRRKVNFMIGLEKQGRRDPKAFPRNPDDEDAAQAATDSLRYICDAEDWDEKRSQAFENMLIEGTGAIMVGGKTDRSGLTPMLAHVPWDRFFADQHSRRHDFSDAAFMGIVTWFDKEEADNQWPDKTDVIVSTMASAWSDTYEDRPRWKTWADNKRKRVRVIELYYIEAGQWMRCVFTEQGYLEEPDASPYLDEDGQPECPLYAVSLYVDRENNRYGDVRDMIDPQDEINKRRSKGLHLMTMRQAKIPEGSSAEPERVRQELARPDGIVQGDIEILDHNDMAASNFNLLQEAKAEIDLQGANAALQGKNENDMSGRAILAQQQGGMVEVALHMDRLRHLTLRVYEAIWSRVRQYWEGERWIRVTDDERKLRFVGVNQPVTAGQKMQEELEQSEDMQQRIMADPGAAARLALFLESPEAAQVIEVRNTPSEIDIDIVIDEGMDTPSIQAEQWQELVKLASTGIPIPPDVLIQASQLRDKDKLIEMLQQPDPMAQQQQQIEQAKEVADVEKTQSETQLNQTRAQAEQVDSEAQVFKMGMEAAPNAGE